MNKRQDRLEALERQVAKLERQLKRLNYWSQRYLTIQIAIFIGGILICIPALAITRWLGGVVVLIATLSFSIIANNRGKVDKSIVRYQIWLRMTQAQVARMQLDWHGIPTVPERDEHANHPFDLDLDISGERSLHQLINTGVSFEGTMRLREWLLGTDPDIEVIRKRRLLVQELVPLVRFRKKFMFHSLFVTRYSPEQLEGRKLQMWLEERQKRATSPHTLGLTLLVGALLSLTTFVVVALYVMTLLPPWLCIVPPFLSIVWFFVRGKEQANLFGDTAYLKLAFSQLQSIFEYLEKYPYGKNAALKELCEPFYIHSNYRPSLLLKRLARLASLATFTDNQEVALFLNALLPWDAYIAYQLRKYEEQLTKRLPAWLDTWFELEGLCSLANFAYMKPQYTMPRILVSKEQDKQITFRGTGLGHPLIKDEGKVVNDFELHNLGDIVVITGSNMAGKSTFLRTLGINLCLAYAGAPVDASSLEVSLFDLYACIKVNDSVIDGYSYFYAEVRRLKGLLTRLEQGTHFPVFFLIDEIFKGTNNYERVAGSAAYIYALIGKKCVGAISTHDLELVKLAEKLPVIKNYHFREDVIEGKMTFDYKLRSGPSPTRNALKIMALEGLPVTIPSQFFQMDDQSVS